jgi:glycosyltransferase involved in cell wall biosynthesis
MYRKTILFYTQNRWAFGQIHHALIKRLWQHNYYCQLLDWTKKYSELEWDYLNRKFDIFVTTPEAINSLKQNKIALNKIVSVAHAEKDIIGGIVSSDIHVFERIKSFGVVHEDLLKACLKLGIIKLPSLVKVGIDFNHFYAPISKKLNTLGYAGELNHIAADKEDCKRAHLIFEVVKKAKINFKQHGFFNHIAMAGYYTDIDASICASRSETAGLPSMEAAAAGRLVMSTGVGYFDGSYGALLRTPPEEFVEDAVNALELYRNPDIYVDMCEKSQQYSRDNHDWGHHINNWIELFE